MNGSFSFYLTLLRLMGTKQFNFLKDTAMVKRLNDLNTLPDKDKEYILYALDGLIKSAKIKAL